MAAKRIAIECDTEDQLSYIPQVQGMVQKSGFTSEILSSEQIIAGELFDFDAVIFPGGMGAFYGLREYEGFADAYSILGLKPDAPLEDVKTHYRQLAMVFHSDRGGMNDEAMKLLNRAYERITKAI